jgi:hypothetical protein
MKGFFKSLLTIGAVAGVAYLGYKAYKIIDEIMKLKKTLPDYLKDLLDEKPTVDVSIKLNSITLAIGLSAETFENLDFDLDEQVQSYIFDYYPSITKLRITTQKYIKTSVVDEDYDVKTGKESFGAMETEED